MTTLGAVASGLLSYNGAAGSAYAKTASTGSNAQNKPTLPASTYSAVAGRTSLTVSAMRSAMPASGWLASSTTCSG